VHEVHPDDTQYDCGSEYRQGAAIDKIHARNIERLSSNASLVDFSGSLPVCNSVNNRSTI
jgi:hypothetical protein